MILTRLTLFFIFFSVLASAAQEPFTEWTLSQAQQILNSSPWARQETYADVVGGVGSGISGEKEIFNTFYVRFVSARPIREALARIQQIQYGYDGLIADDKGRFDRYIQETLLSGFGGWVIVCVSFRSNDPNRESEVRRFFKTQTSETLRSRAFLSTRQFSQMPIHAYFPPRDEGIGAKFIFPRSVNGKPVVTDTGEYITFELLDVPAATPFLSARFSMKDMFVNGELDF
jgi:hypothetical protein